MRDEARMGGAATGEMFASLDEAEGTVDGEANLCGVLVLLAVVFPPADWAKSQGTGDIQRFVPAARAAVASKRQRLHL
jgi:hypothetical protein